LKYLAEKFLGRELAKSRGRKVLAAVEQVSDYRFPDSRTVDGYSHKKHSKIPADYSVSGLDSWSATNPSYIPALRVALVHIFEGSSDQTSIVVVLPSTLDMSKPFSLPMREGGFQYISMPPDDPDNFSGPSVTQDQADIVSRVYAYRVAKIADK